MSTYVTTVAGVECEPGCWVDGHWGQYGPDHLADRASELGWEPETCLDDPRELRRITDHIDDMGYTRGRDVRSDAIGIQTGFYELVPEACDKIENWLNEHTPDGYVWHWRDGEFFLSPICDDEDDCTDDTCAHWD
jgi:hypothetical protein